MKTLVLVEAAIVAAVAVVALGGGQAPRAQPGPLLTSLEGIEVGEAWPGFRLTDWPVAVFDGTVTLLLHHPSPPAAFKPIVRWPVARVYSGRYPGVAGNSTVEIGGTRTATVVAGPGPASESVRLAYVEELFHVFWFQRHADLRPNEMTRYSYPIKNARNLELMLAEDEALARALDAGDAAAAASWAATAFRLRAEREGLLTADARAFETGLEMMEGVANYVARGAVGLKPGETARRLRDERQADQIRWRYYESGAAICLLLDRLVPAWKGRIDSEPGQTTIALLQNAVSRGSAHATPFSPADMAAFENRAVEAIARLNSHQRRVRSDVAEREGPRVVIETAQGGNPFRVRRFDPINLLVLDGGEVVHPRNLTLSSPAGTVEIVNPAYARGSFAGLVALTAAAGRHPLADGVRGLTLVGLRSVPRVEREGGALLVTADGVRIVLRHADVRVDGETLRIRVAAAAPSTGEDWGAASLRQVRGRSYRGGSRVARISPAWSRQAAALCPSGTST